MAILSLCKFTPKGHALRIAIFGFFQCLMGSVWALEGSTLFEGRLSKIFSYTTNQTPILFSSAQYFTVSDWTQVQDVSGKWQNLYQPKEGSNLALSKYQVEIGFLQGEWGFAYARRNDTVIEANRDALDLLYLQKNNLPIPQNTVYRPSISASNLTAQGPEIFKRFTLFEKEDARVLAALGVSYLTGGKIRQTQLLGQVQATGGSTYALNISNWSDIDSGKTYPFMRDGSPTGSGYAMDIALHARWGKHHRAWLTVDDWQTKLQWKQVPSTQATADSKTANRDSNGFISYAPVIQGTNARLDTTQRIDPTTIVGYARDIGATTLSAESMWISGVAIPSAGIGYRVNDTLRLIAGRDFRFGTVTSGLAWNNLAISLYSNRLDFSGSKGYGVALRYQIKLHN